MFVQNMNIKPTVFHTVVSKERSPFLKDSTRLRITCIIFTDKMAVFFSDKNVDPEVKKERRP
jgi:hypothetical protein